MDPVAVIERTAKPLGRWATLITSIGVIGGAAWFWYTNIWIPKVEVSDVDYDKGTANVIFANPFGIKKSRTLYSGSSIGAGGGWGIRFTSDNPYSDDKPNRVELIRNDLTYKTLHTSVNI